MAGEKENWFRHAIVRRPAANFAAGITRSGLGPPDLGLALRQHRDYCRALATCGLKVSVLKPDPRYPDSTFVEDTAVLTPRLAVVAHPGAPSREGETEAIASVLAGRFLRIRSIVPPGTLDGGDVCQAGRRFFIGISTRTNEAGARQLAEYLQADSYDCRLVPLAGDAGVLHLKSGMAHLGNGRLVVDRGWTGRSEFVDYELIPVPDGESYAANCLQLNGRVLLAAGHPRLEAILRGLGYELLVLGMSEFRKMDGGLSCLSLRY